ncbi:delta-1-pyrroline-5-carboxylate dehydrogenase [Leptothrix cholodnii SP-6]|uniref:Bifunctional protein PutA n=1 Tax=Leptothrix cholodnii (strain ATCC 51168 / LMG 8142 / SP-6) TaxID=395495 RepID=B1XXB4_LEPCP|nr:L-glutamate gamma-semialdehyde dehydrogenase [Leptothrix cholodnii]ACB33895.1 delta-1-pyrroline-5-carboxylate dehydrogenase [Leptothrix cholodnii SP-6]
MPLPLAQPAAAALVGDRLPSPLRDEAEQVQRLLGTLTGAAAAGPLDWSAVVGRATPWVEAVRGTPAPFWALESLLHDYPISSAEGLALMRLAEALLRVPDTATAIALTADQLGRGDFSAHAAHAGSAHPLMASLAARSLDFSRKLLPEAGGGQPGLLQRLGAQTVVAATVRAIQLLGKQFVLGQSIAEALDIARAASRKEPGLVHSFDMLGEGARTDADARHYLAAYQGAIAAIAKPGRATSPESADGISIKLSALDARYEAAQSASVFKRLLPRLIALVDAAAAANINLTIDAEESERLELSLQVLDALAAHAARTHPDWTGLGLAVQAYQTRASDTVAAVVQIARQHQRRLMVRLVKGAYWDSEIKRAQELGLAAYPVFTDKRHTDLSYLACARALLAASDCIYPQFATHNAATIAALLQMARAPGARFELQRLHGMGEAVYREVLKDLRRTPDAPPLRIYAPVGEHRDLLAYLVRRLLENGANSSFVHQLADPTVDVITLLTSPLHAPSASSLPLPVALYGAGRANSAGRDLHIAAHRLPMIQTLAERGRVGLPPVSEASVDQAREAMHALHASQPAWNATPLAHRCAVLQRAADALEARMDEFVALLVHEGGKTLADGVSEVREAVDFCRYYAEQAATKLAPQTLPGPTGESNELRLHGRGAFVCISPWNFPLAIFAGQVVAALVAGNTVAAKPAEQTPAVAMAFVHLLIQAGLPENAIALLHGPGETVGAALVAHTRCAGVCFTGSTQVARAINRVLAERDGAIVPLIAETGGLNAMVVDSSALPEQVVDAVVQSAFRSAGQRCSALRLLCVHDEVADKLLEMLSGAMAELVSGDPRDAAHSWAVDIGPVIDAEAHANLARHVRRLDESARLIARSALPDALAATHIAPVAYEIADIGAMREEVFGPVLHVLRWRGDPDALVAQINGLGYGLTLGVHTRIDGRALRIAEQARVGNVYINRNMIGAVVGVQPFGGEGLSGTGPKAGGPHYLYRFCGEQTVTINTAAAGGNATLLAGTAAANTHAN